MTKLNLACGPHHLDDFVNLDAGTGWRFEFGFPDYDAGSIEALSESHGLMYVPIAEWPFVFAEFARVLEPGGIVRITEDSTDDPESERFGGFHDAITLTTPALVRKHLRSAGLTVKKHTATSTGYVDDSLLQAWHGPEPKVFFLEGRKA